jgi:hypothetical protein
MRMPYETLSVTTAGTSHDLVPCAPYPIADSRNQTIGRRYNPEMIQIRKLDWILSERRFGFSFFAFIRHLYKSQPGYLVKKPS